MSVTPEAAAAALSTVDDMAESIARKLDRDREVRQRLAIDRAAITAQIKELDVEIDKAERMTKALIPRHRNSSKAVS